MIDDLKDSAKKYGELKDLRLMQLSSFFGIDNPCDEEFAKQNLKLCLQIDNDPSCRADAIFFTRDDEIVSPRIKLITKFNHQDLTCNMYLEVDDSCIGIKIQE